MPPLYHILIPAAVAAWNIGVVWAFTKLGRQPIEKPPKVYPMPKPRRFQRREEPVRVYYDLW